MSGSRTMWKKPPASPCFVMFYAPNDPIRGSDEHLSIALSVPTPENTARRRRHKMLGKLAAKFRCEHVASMRTLKSSF